jgi:alpha/beta superfamily hydrolase
MLSTITPVLPASTPRPESAILRSLSLQGAAGRLEALLNKGAASAPYAALVCHPHPLGGGSMHNKVVFHAMKVLNDPAWGFNWPVLRFNFRGVGLSQGAHHGDAETGDVLAALEWLENEYKRPVVVCGFSFGAVMALKACCGHPLTCSSADVRTLIALGLPTQAEGRNYDYSFLPHCTIPKLLLSGDRDQFAPAQQLAQVASSAAEPKQLVLLPGADHFFTGQLNSMQRSLAGWLQRNPSTCPPKAQCKVARRSEPPAHRLQGGVYSGFAQEEQLP